jgi:hypothetical protein
MAKRFVIKIEGTDKVKEGLLEIEKNVRKMREDLMRLEGEPLNMTVEEMDDENSSSNN